MATTAIPTNGKRSGRGLGATVSLNKSRNPYEYVAGDDAPDDDDDEQMILFLTALGCVNAILSRLVSLNL